MKIFTESTTCSICGGPGVCRLGDSWFLTRHINLAICAGYLATKKKELDKREKQIERKRIKLRMVASSVRFMSFPGVRKLSRCKTSKTRLR